MPNFSTPIRYPALYQLNTRVYLTTRAQDLARKATLDDIADGELDRLAALGFDWVWLLGVWQLGAASSEISRTNPAWQAEFRRVLPAVTDADIGGSCFAIQRYVVSAELGGDEALARLRARLQARGLRLLLDFVPNHTALDHPWVLDHPERFVHGSRDDLSRAPENFCRLIGSDDAFIFAHGRDPNFTGWPDTLQLDYSNPATVSAMQAELLHIAARCDGVRCDMAMLVLPEVFLRTWGRTMAAFWPTAIASVRAAHPHFMFMAEVYWDLEWAMQQQGFDYTYDKRLYDRLRAASPAGIRAHLGAGMDFQDKLVRFLENHDEPRAAEVFPRPMQQAAAALAYTVPGLRFFHQGQLEGYRQHLPTHLVRGPAEETDPELAEFYARLLRCLRTRALREGLWRRCEPRPAWDGNASVENYLIHTWTDGDTAKYLVAVNYSPHQAQCFAPLPWPRFQGPIIRFRDRLSAAIYDRDRDALLMHGLYLDLPPWGCHLFELTQGLSEGEMCDGVR
ncbi:MAG: alpha-amylase [Gammaproteobacteria bacterium]|nr:alpha-amylase [Gammaproteobacteria bacterium]